MTEPLDDGPPLRRLEVLTDEPPVLVRPIGLITSSNVRGVDGVKFTPSTSLLYGRVLEAGRLSKKPIAERRELLAFAKTDARCADARVEEL